VRSYHSFRCYGPPTHELSLERILAYFNIDHEPATVDGGKPPAYWPASGDLRVEKLCARYSSVSLFILVWNLGSILIILSLRMVLRCFGMFLSTSSPDSVLLLVRGSFNRDFSCYSTQTSLSGSNRKRQELAHALSASLHRDRRCRLLRWYPYPLRQPQRSSVQDHHYPPTCTFTSKSSLTLC
jgi:hypothetical protein